MIDRNARDQMAAIIRSYMTEEIAAFELDTKTSKIFESTQDLTIREIWFILYGYFDDVKNHQVVATREIWKYFHRMLLVLESDGEYRIVRSCWSWNSDQFLAFGGLLIYIVLFFVFGIMAQLYLVALLHVVLIPLIVWIYKRRNARVLQRFNRKRRVMPFSSFRNLRYWREQVPQFKRIRLTCEIEHRRVRNIYWAKFWEWTSTALFGLFFAPLVLLFFCSPQKEFWTTIDDCRADRVAPM